MDEAAELGILVALAFGWWTGVDRDVVAVDDVIIPLAGRLGVGIVVDAMALLLLFLSTCTL